MSAIAGLFRLDGAPVSPAALSPALSLMEQYGRDARGLWSSGPIALGCQVQHFTPEAVGPSCGRPEEDKTAHSAALPETAILTRGPLTVVADARLDGRPELCAALDVPSAERAMVSDEALLLRAWERWGEGCTEHLVGDYAFAVWDAGARRLFLARDHIGARPLFYWHTEREFAFATDLPALLAIPGVRRELDEVEVGWLLLNLSPGAHDNVRTYYRGVRKLPFGHTLTVDDRGLRVARYWFPERLPDVRLARHADYVEQLYALVERAVGDCLRTRLPVGAHLSGGLDSSSVAVLAARLQRQRGAAVPTMFSWSPPPGSKPEETEHRRIVAICQQEGLTPLYTEATDDDERWMAELDISLRPALTMGLERSVQVRAAAQGVGLMLSGWGGDEGVSYNGRGLAADYLVRGEWGALAGYLGLGRAWRRPGLALVALRAFWDSAVLPTLPAALWERLAYRQARSKRGEPFIRVEFAERIRPHLRTDVPHVREVPGSRRCQAALYYHGHVTARMESWAAFGAEHGLTYAYPLTDRRVLEFVYGVPPELHYQPGQGRVLYRHATSKLFPPAVPWDSVKQDPALAERQKERQEAKPLAAVHERLCQPNPWVDTVRLREALKHPPTLTVRHALAALTLWQQEQGRAGKQAVEG
ncbi:MAG: hypothetical protein RL514_3673 [Verrucomicrobiota bacterium]|jgi:asparagine synthase (glutamine-hydrolysing)